MRSSGSRGRELELNVLVAGELVEPGDGEVRLQEPVAGARGLKLVVVRISNGRWKRR